jgi:dihydroorotase
VLTVRDGVDIVASHAGHLLVLNPCHDRSFVSAPSLFAQPAQYDLLLQGGRVIDPKNNVDELRDVAIRNGRIAAVAPNMPTSSARKTIDLTGLYVTPGLVDIRVHVYVQSAPGTVFDGSSSVIPDHATFRTAVTAVVDAGTTGWRSFPDLKRRVIEPSRTRVLAMLNIGATACLKQVQRSAYGRR